MRAIPDVVYVLDSAGRFTYLNDAVRRLGWDPARLIGRHFSTIVHPEDAPKVSREDVLPMLCGRVTGVEGAPRLFDERRSGDRMTRNLELRLLAGNERVEGAAEGWALGAVNAFGEVNAVGFSMPELRGNPGGTIGVIRDVTLRRVSEDALKRDLRSREVLLREIHHRVKNNLQVVSSLLNLQQHAVDDARAQAVFLECQTQIQSMAMVHEQIYQRAELDGVSAAGYIDSLVRYLAGVYEAEWHGIAVGVEGRGEVKLDLDSAIPAAIIVNELVSNAFKHAFPGGRKGTVRVRLDVSDSGEAIIEVADDGVGFDASKAARAPDAPRSLGLDLVQALARQLRGELSLREREGGGAIGLLRFKPLLREGPLEAVD
ncbi:MAG: PAS domain-containing protein [Spirochaetales bacterium]|nr:PAS domain-containing protein [Spirochaetales bacterium]